MINLQLIVAFYIILGLFYSTAAQSIDQYYDVESKLPATAEDDDREINCDGFSEYVVKCTSEAIGMYNASRFTPPAAGNLADWCKSIVHLAHCGSQWNERCSEVSDNRFQEESVKGHMFVVSGICNNEAYIERYKWNTNCIPWIESDWEYCYRTFKDLIGEQKNGSLPWTHYETHFQLCCIRAQFRRCTLERLTASCNAVESIVLQKFSVIISEGEVFQNCERGVVYEKCPGGDPRPSQDMMPSVHKPVLRMRTRSSVDVVSPSEFVFLLVFCMRSAI